MTAACTLLPWEALVAYRMGEVGAAEEARMEEHYFSCGACAGRLEAVEGLRGGVVALVESGRVTGSVTGEVLDRFRARGLRLRTYALTVGEPVACTAAPTDDFVVVRLCLPHPIPGAQRVDLAVEASLLGTGERMAQRLDDVVVDPASGDVVMLYAGALIRSLPRSQWRCEVRVHQGEAEHALGPFLLDHTPWDERPAS